MHVDYETYAAMSFLRKNKVLGEMDAANREELVRTHIGRFLDRNREQLSDEQRQALQDMLARYPDVRDYTEHRMIVLFPLDLLRQFHMEMFKNSGDIPNPLARLLALATPHAIDEELLDTLRDLATLSVVELQEKRPELPELLARHYDALPGNLWALVPDEDVPLAASRALSVSQFRRSGGLHPRPAPC